MQKGVFHNRNSKRQSYDMYDLEKIEQRRALINIILKQEKETEERKNKIRFVTSKAHTDDKLRNTLKNIVPKSVIECRGESGFKTLQLLDNEVDCFIFPNSGYKRYKKNTHILRTYFNKNLFY